MKTFREFLESEAPASVDNNVGKPVGGKKEKDDVIQRTDSLEAIDKEASSRNKSFKELFGNVFGDIFKDKNK